MDNITRFCELPNGRYQKNFVQVPFELFENGVYLSERAKVVYITLISFRNNKNSKTYPSYQKIMERSGLNKDQVAAALNELEYFGWIERKKGFQSVNNYTLMYPNFLHPDFQLARLYKKEHRSAQRTVITTTRDEYGEAVTLVAPIIDRAEFELNDVPFWIAPIVLYVKTINRRDIHEYPVVTYRTTGSRDIQDN